MTKPVKRILVCGGRDFDNYPLIKKYLDQLKPENGVAADLVIIEGGAAGVDSNARRWCREVGRPCMTFQACWDAYGKAAGGIRNAWMLKFGEPDLVIAFPGGFGTRNMVSQAEAADIIIWNLMEIKE